jgi:hypothetical protein
LLAKIVSGGQTGADRAALDVARAWRIATGGWVPAGRLAEDGRIADVYEGLAETADVEPSERTRFNVRDSDGTLILSHGALVGGSALTRDVAGEIKRPCLHVDLSQSDAAASVSAVHRWIEENKIRVLNVAGPRASEDPQIHFGTTAVLSGLLVAMRSPESAANEDQTGVAIALFEHAADNFRHWDTMRWAIPSWYLTLAAALIGVSQFISESPDIELLAYTCFGFAIFGALCLLLQINLTRYHVKAMRRLPESLAPLNISPNVRRALELDLGFAFGKRGLFWTATFWFGLATLIMIALLVYAGLGALRDARESGQGGGDDDQVSSKTVWMRPAGRDELRQFLHA